ncbi:hypothetical protein DICPUDRAFT_30899 [Dictyostelium purpureum]|uniref:Glutathione S-transferase n=1 Tax=Dictyostelium purpureum TaxID=5786 RepID=F0ZG64_DICPU|nr:uncharacterized protein DICPUDRAFT_30899 [Dictyostelium purpureum]EGC37048.1 hypothetical protein DICPUDRAFT_30899 [Dictyostelium purpureum]|eukprot:XP_003286405.1 hypothetical protein DICPUDRAFT_30899 [Dictyostelium purpureum]
MEKLKIQQDFLEIKCKNFDNQYISPRRSEGKPDYQVYAFYTSCSLRVYFMFDELNIPYQDCPINIRLGEHYKGEFAEITPNNKIPMLVDNTLLKDNGEPDEPLRIFESGAILLYLAEKYPESSLLPPISKPRERSETTQWLIWQVSEMGPCISQYVYYFFYASEPIPFGMKKAQKDVMDILNVLNKRLEGREYLCNKYSIADIALFGWGCFLYFGIIPELNQFTNITRWMNTMIQKPTYQKFLPRIEHSLKIRNLKRLDNNEYLFNK